jgi:preprotein translocase subunit SecG
MYTAITILIILTCVLLVLVVLVQNPKGGGISTGIIGSNQVMGVKKTTDFIEKLTWGLALSLVVLCLIAGMTLPSNNERGLGTTMQEQIDNSAAAPVQQQQQPAQQQAQPQQQKQQAQPQQQMAKPKETKPEGPLQ